jgi:hypothetical protein
MAEKINAAGLNENTFGDSDFILMRQMYEGPQKTSLALLLNLSEFCAEMRPLGRNLLGFPSNSVEASVKSGACIRSEKYPPPDEKFERNGWGWCSQPQVRFRLRSYWFP